MIRVPQEIETVYLHQTCTVQDFCIVFGTTRTSDWSPQPKTRLILSTSLLLMLINVLMIHRCWTTWNCESLVFPQNRYMFLVIWSWKSRGHDHHDSNPPIPKHIAMSWNLNPWGGFGSIQCIQLRGRSWRNGIIWFYTGKPIQPDAYIKTYRCVLLEINTPATMRMILGVSSHFLARHIDELLYGPWHQLNQ